MVMARETIRLIAIIRFEIVMIYFFIHINILIGNGYCRFDNLPGCEADV